jgi:hypothetical protein
MAMTAKTPQIHIDRFSGAGLTGGGFAIAGGMGGDATVNAPRVADAAAPTDAAIGAESLLWALSGMRHPTACHIPKTCGIVQDDQAEQIVL